MVGIAILGLLQQLVAFDVAQAFPRIEDVALACLLELKLNLKDRGWCGLWLIGGVYVASVANAALVTHF